MYIDARDGTGREKIWKQFCSIVLEYWEQNLSNSLGGTIPHILTKEKYGRLDCTCYDGCDLTIQEWAEYLERVSEKTCMQCGEPGEKRDLHRITTLCDKCYKK